MNIGFIGCGKMGGALIQGVIQNAQNKGIKNIDNIAISASSFENALAFCKNNSQGQRTIDFEHPKGYVSKQNVNITLVPCSNYEIAKKCSVVFLAIKPGLLPCVLKQINLPSSSVLVSMAAGVNTKAILSYLYPRDDWPPHTKIIRIMPNVAACIMQSMTGVYCNEYVEKQDKDVVIPLLECCGKVDLIKEDLMDALTAISGSGVAYCFMFMDALCDAAVRFGLSKQKAFLYAAQTLKGAADMVLLTKDTPANLKDSVCSPKGTTIEAVAKLEEKGFRSCIIEAATACYKKSLNMTK